MDQPINMFHTIFSLVNDFGKYQIKWNYQLLSKQSFESLQVVHKVYDKQVFIWLNDTRKKLQPKNTRTCRFCGKSHPEVKFSQIAHAFPESIGNKHHLSDFECDICNYKFGVYENDFANFLSAYRTLAEFSGKKGIPKFKSRYKQVTIEQAYKNAIDITLSEQNIKNNITTSVNGEFLRITAEGIPYKPINVFKCLLRTALSMVDNEDLKYLSNTMKFLMDDCYITDQSNDFILSMHQYFVPGNFNAPPFLIHYKKATEYIGFPAPSLIYIFYIRNLILQIFVPFHDHDSFIYMPNVEKSMFIVPPLINRKWFDTYGGPFPQLVNLNDRNVRENKQVSDFKLFKK
jgi:hypothetical protein